MTTGSIRIAMTSDVGLRRKNNQDTGFAQQGVFMVCDGMGGGKGGEQASQLAAQHFAQLAAMPSRTRQDIDDTLARAQHDILDLGDRLGGVAGTTCSGLVLPQDHADSASARSAALFSDADDQDFSDQTYVVNVGDSRTYHLSPLTHADAPATDIIPVWDAASLTRITRDHSQRQEAIDSGQMLPEEAEATISRNIITQCLGDSGWHHARRICRRSDRPLHHLFGWIAWRGAGRTDRGHRRGAFQSAGGRGRLGGGRS